MTARADVLAPEILRAPRGWHYRIRPGDEWSWQAHLTCGDALAALGAELGRFSPSFFGIVRIRPAVPAARTEYLGAVVIETGYNDPPRRDTLHLCREPNGRTLGVYADGFLTFSDPGQRIEAMPTVGPGPCDVCGYVDAGHTCCPPAGELEAAPELPSMLHQGRNWALAIADDIGQAIGDAGYWVLSARIHDTAVKLEALLADAEGLEVQP